MNIEDGMKKHAGWNVLLPLLHSHLWTLRVVRILRADEFVEKDLTVGQNIHLNNLLDFNLFLPMLYINPSEAENTYVQ